MALNKITGLVGKPIRTDRATAQMDILGLARVLVEVDLEQEFPHEVSYYDEKGLLQT